MLRTREMEGILKRKPLYGDLVRKMKSTMNNKAKDTRNQEFQNKVEQLSDSLRILTNTSSKED